MDRKEVIRMAKKVGSYHYNGEDSWEFGEQNLIFFASLVAAAERERCAKDAERYRAIKERGWIECPNCITPWKCNGPHITGGEELDAAIDAAIRALP